MINFIYSFSSLIYEAFVSERSKELDSSSSVFALVGSNPTECISFLFAECLLLTLSLMNIIMITTTGQCNYSLDSRCYNLSLLFNLYLFIHAMTISHI